MTFRKRLLIIIGIPLGISLILVIALLFLGSDIAKRTNQIKQLREELFLRVHLGDSLAILHKEFEQVQPHLPALERFLVSRDQLVTFPRDLTIIAKASNVDLNAALGKETPRTPTSLGTTEVIISGTASFENLINFLKNLENSYYFVRLIKLDLTRQDGDFKTLLTGQIFSF